MIIMEEDKNNTEIKIEIVEDGPLNITGPIIFKDLKRDVTVNMDDVSLCLCETDLASFCKLLLQ